MKKKLQRNVFVKWFRRLVVTGCLLAFLGVSFVAYVNVLPMWASRGQLYTDVTALPKARVGLIFGTTDRVDGRENLYFRYRIDAAEKAWKAGKLDTIIVSGDNREKNYNEPRKMKAALVARGVPAGRIVSDYAGLRTLDSVVRAKEIFGADPIMFISQKFQNERAIYLAEAHGISAIGFDAKDVEGRGGLKTKTREVAARIQMWLDVHFLNTRPKFLGEKVELPD